MENPRVKLSKAEFERYEVHYPANVVIVRIAEKDIITSSGIKVNFNDEVQYAEGDDNHIANMACTNGIIVKQVEKLYYHRKDVVKSMSWKTALETHIGDTVFFHHLASKNCSEIDVEGAIHKVINYEDLLVAKRLVFENSISETWTIPLNGNIILQEVYKDKLSWLDILEPEVDKFKGIVRFNGSDNIEYQARGVADIKGLKEGELVMIDKSSYPFYLERSRWNSSFDGDKQYLTSQKRHIQAVI